MKSELAIAVNNLSKVYKSSSDDAKLALDNISLTIKTTLLPSSIWQNPMKKQKELKGI